MTITHLAKRSIKTTAVAIDRVRPPAAGIVVLIYHRVGATRGGEMNVAPEVFDRQLARLTETCRILSLDAATNELAGPIGGPAAPGVVLTFDDGSADWLDVVLPILSRYSTPAVWYVASGFIENGRLPDGEPAASWAGLREAASSPLITLGCHTHSHRLLDRLEPGEIDVELDRSIDLIATETGVRTEHFAYPKALAPTPWADGKVRSRFRTAALAGTRPNRMGTDLHALARSPIQASDTAAWFDRKVAGGMWFEDAVRERANRLRYRRLNH